MSLDFTDDGETDEMGRYVFGLHDHIEIVSDAIDDAIHDLSGSEVQALCAAIRAKIGAVLHESRRRRPAALERPPERELADRWWDR